MSFVTLKKNLIQLIKVIVYGHSNYSVKALEGMQSTDPNHGKSPTVIILLSQMSTSLTTDTSCQLQTSDTKY